MRAWLVAVVLTGVVSSCADNDGPREWQVTGTVLEDATHGPHLCFQVNMSDPPQCKGYELAGWDWDLVSDEERGNHTTWTSAHITGTWDPAAKRFTLTRPPRPSRDEPWPEPDVMSTSTSVERLDEIIEEVLEDSDELGVVVTASVDTTHRVVSTLVMVADSDARKHATSRWGRAVALAQLLQPAEPA